MGYLQLITLTRDLFTIFILNYKFLQSTPSFMTNLQCPSYHLKLVSKLTNWWSGLSARVLSLLFPPRVRCPLQSTK